jgi:asparagine synthase (glutamine-hydrolysing)
MCGIVALFSPDQPAHRLEIVQRMLSTITHRGPDDAGVMAHERTTLGFRRLSILDLSLNGHQPMTSADGSCSIVFNGEIYNYVELRRQLQAAGHVFASTGDTEVLLHAYMHWGRDAVERLNGMWAFVIIDRRSGTVFGSRDRFGIKPLFRCNVGGHVMLASEIKAIRASGLYRDDINPCVVADYLLDGRLDETPQTFYRGIEQVPAAHSFEIAADGSFTQWRYWSVSSASEQPHEEPAAAFAYLFEDAVRMHMRSDVPVAVHLSGGLDSSSILCASARVRGESGAVDPLKAFSFSDGEFDESRYIQDTIANAGAHLQCLQTDAARVWADLPRMLAAQDEPVHSLTAVIGYQLMALTQADGIRVILNGQGADETLGGYPSYFRDGWMTLLKQGGLAPAWREVTAYALDSGNSASTRFFDLLRHALQSKARASATYRTLAQRRYRRLRRSLPWAEPDLAKLVTGYPDHESPQLRSSLARSVEVTPLPIYLRVEDRNSMAHSVEARVPFLDHRLVELAFGLPRQWKLRGGFNKVLLRDAMQNRIPESVRARRDKMGFPVPAARWMRSDLYPRLRELFADLGGSVAGWVRLDGVQGLLEEHRVGTSDHSQVLFRVAQLMLWKDATSRTASSSASPFIQFAQQSAQTVVRT